MKTFLDDAITLRLLLNKAEAWPDVCRLPVADRERLQEMKERFESAALAAPAHESAEPADEAVCPTCVTCGQPWPITVEQSTDEIGKLIEETGAIRIAENVFQGTRCDFVRFCELRELNATHPAPEVALAPAPEASECDCRWICKSGTVGCPRLAPEPAPGEAPTLTDGERAAYKLGRADEVALAPAPSAHVGSLSDAEIAQVWSNVGGSRHGYTYFARAILKAATEQGGGQP